MVITHRPLPALSKSRPNFGLQSFLSRSSRLMALILEQIRPSQSQGFRTLLYRFYPGQDGFATWNPISEFQRTKLENNYKLTATLSSALYLGPKGTEFYGAFDNFVRFALKKSLLSG